MSPREESIWPNSDWTLTWPIWHMLPRQERKELAQKHGYRTIGEFEEYMSLQQAVGDASTDNVLPYENQLIYGASVLSIDKQNANIPANSGSKRDIGDDDEDENSAANEQQLHHDMLQDEYSCCTSAASNDERCLRGGALLMLPEETLHRIFDFLPVDSYATLALVSPHWKNFTRTESVYKRLCERLYLNQSQRRTLHVSRFGNSYRLMLERRPRVKACGGLYVLKYAKVKKIERNMWTDVSSVPCPYSM